MNENISLLEAVLSTLDTIPIIGIDAQDKFVGCANAIRSVIHFLREEQAQREAKAHIQEDTEDGSGD